MHKVPLFWLHMLYVISIAKALPIKDVGTKKSAAKYRDYCSKLGLESAASHTYVEQVASQAVLDALSFVAERPVWTPLVLSELDKRVESGHTISCPHYPHSAEDIATALQQHNLPKLNDTTTRIGVLSSISPWVEHVSLLRLLLLFG